MATIDEMYATDCVYHGASGADIHGLTNVKQFFSSLLDAFPDLHMTIDDMVGEGDRGVVRFTWTGTHKGELRGIPPTNKKVTMWEISIVRIAGGKVVEEWARYDTLGVMQQLGAVPTPQKET